LRKATVAVLLNYYESGLFFDALKNKWRHVTNCSVRKDSKKEKKLLVCILEKYIIKKNKNYLFLKNITIFAASLFSKCKRSFYTYGENL